MELQLEVVTPAGPARIDRAVALGPHRGVLVLGHGAGGGIEARDLLALSQALPAIGVDVLRMTQPWRLAGKRVAVAPPKLDLAWNAALVAAGEAGWLTAPLVLGGRSAGARVACRTAVGNGAVAVLALAFPLHPPGRPEKSRADELLAAGVPTLVVQGERDPFGGPGEFPPGTRLHAVPGADHGFKVPARGEPSQRDALDLLVAGVRDWWLELG